MGVGFPEIRDEGAGLNVEDCGFEFKVHGLGAVFRVIGSGLMVQGWGLDSQILEMMGQDFMLRIKDFDFKVQG